MSKKTQIISTRLSFKDKKKGKFLILGDWCLDGTQNLQKYNLEKNRWNRRKLVEKDYKYIKKIFNILNEKIPFLMNSYHKTNYKKKFWQSLLWIWLSHYLASIYFRWKTVENIIYKNKNLSYYSRVTEKNLCCYDTLGFYDFVSSSDYYNEYLFLKIIKKFENKVLVNKVNKKIIFKDYIDKEKKYSFKIELFQKIFFYLSKILLCKGKFLNNGGFSIKNFFYLHFKKLSIPLIVEEEFKRSNKKKLFVLSESDQLKRNNLKLNILPKNNFEKFLYENIKLDIPMFFLEKFNNELNNINRKKIDPKLIISSTEHYYNEKYKTWILLKKFSSKTKISIIEHGGNHTDLNWNFGYDKVLGDEFFSWHKINNKKKLPVPKYIGFTSKISEKKNLIYCGYESLKYPSKISRSPFGLENLKSFYNMKQIKHKLDKKIYKNFFYCEKKFEDTRIENNLIKLIGEKKIKKRGSFLKELESAKLLICDYPQTTFFDCILRCPTLLIVDYKNNWQPNKDLEKIYNELKKNHILFNRIEDAIKFINLNWDNLDEWWYSNKISDVKKKLISDFNIDVSKSSLSKWEDYIGNC